MAMNRFHAPAKDCSVLAHKKHHPKGPIDIKYNSKDPLEYYASSSSSKDTFYSISEDESSDSFYDIKKLALKQQQNKQPNKLQSHTQEYEYSRQTCSQQLSKRPNNNLKPNSILKKVVPPKLSQTNFTTPGPSNPPINKTPQRDSQLQNNRVQFDPFVKYSLVKTPSKNFNNQQYNASSSLSEAISTYPQEGNQIINDFENNYRAMLHFHFNTVQFPHLLCGSVKKESEIALGQIFLTDKIVCGCFFAVFLYIGFQLHAGLIIILIPLIFKGFLVFQIENSLERYKTLRLRGMVNSYVKLRNFVWIIFMFFLIFTILVTSGLIYDGVTGDSFFSTNIVQWAAKFNINLKEEDPNETEIQKQEYFYYKKIEISSLMLILMFCLAVLLLSIKIIRFSGVIKEYCYNQKIQKQLYEELLYNKRQLNRQDEDEQQANNESLLRIGLREKEVMTVFQQQYCQYERELNN